MSSSHRRFGPVASVLLSLSAGCGSPITEPPPPPPPSVRVAPSTVSLGLNDAFQLEVSVVPALAGVPVAWSSSNAAVAEVTATGVVRAVGIGVAVITATVRSESGRAGVTVGQPACRIILRCG